MISKCRTDAVFLGGILSEDYRKEMNTIRKTFEDQQTSLVEKDAIIAEQQAILAEKMHVLLN